MRKHGRCFLASLGIVTIAASAWAAPPERPSFNVTEDPRPNILPNWIFTHRVPYRLQYNRPPYHSGKLVANLLSPSSQEAMAYCENLAIGKYNGKDCPPLVKGFFYPKPWEVLNTSARPSLSSSPTIKASQPPVDMNALDEAEKETREKKEADEKDADEKEAVKLDANVPAPKPE